MRGLSDAWREWVAPQLKQARPLSMRTETLEGSVAVRVGAKSLWDQDPVAVPSAIGGLTPEYRGAALETYLRRRRLIPEARHMHAKALPSNAIEGGTGIGVADGVT